MSVRKFTLLITCTSLNIWSGCTYTDAETTLGQTHPASTTSLLRADGGDAACTVAAVKPSLWLPLDEADDLGTTVEVVSNLYGQVMSPNGASLFEAGAVGHAVSLDGSNYITVADFDAIDSNPAGFSFGLWVMPRDASYATLLSHAAQFAPGSWRLLSTQKAGIAFEFCDDKGCQTVALDGALPENRWTYVAGILDVMLDDDGFKNLNLTLLSEVGDTTHTLYRTLPLSEDFGFNVSGALTLGASLEPVADPEDYEGPYTITLPRDTFVGMVDEVMFYDAPQAEATLLDVASANGGLCQECIHDKEAPTITCPGTISIMEGYPIRPAEATSADNCDADPTILVAMDEVDGHQSGDVVKVTYTSEDDAGNSSNCTAQVDIIDPPPPGDPADKADLTGGGSCTLVATPSAVVSDSPLTLSVTTAPAQCTNGTCDYYLDISYPIAGAYAGTPQSVTAPFGASFGWTNLNSQGPSATGSWWSLSYNLLQPMATTYTATYRVYDHTTGEHLRTWSCNATVIISPVVSSYCSQPLSYWLNRLITGQIHYYNLNDPNVFSGTGWFDGSSSDDLIIGRPGEDKVRGRGGNDCIVGAGGADFLDGNDGSDRIEGGPGGDTIHGNSGADTAWGHDGIDYIYGDTEGDWISGGTGGDRLWGGADNDQLYGEAGNDRILGDGGSDRIYAGDNNDYVEGGTQPDNIYGGGGCDEIQGNGDYDWITLEGGQNRAWGNDGEDTILGGPLTDYIRGDGNQDELMGGDGDDWICGGAAADMIVGQGGNMDECQQNGGSGNPNCEISNGAACQNDWQVSGLWPCN